MMPPQTRLQRLSQHLMRPATPRGTATGVYAQIPYRRANPEDPDQLVFIQAPQGPEDPLIRHLVEDPTTGAVDAEKMRSLVRQGISAMAPAAFDVRSHCVEDLRNLGATSLLDDAYAMRQHVSQVDMTLLCPHPERLADGDHLRKVATERSKYRLEMEQLAREACAAACPGYSVRLALATDEANIFTRMTDPPCTTTPEVVQRGGPVGASGIVHSDLGAGHGRFFEAQMLEQADEAQRDLLNQANLGCAEELRACRHLILQLWRPITNSPVEMDQLAVLDPRSLRDEDLYGTGLNEEDPADQGGLNVGRFAVYSQRHRWVHISEQTRHEVLIFAGFDSGRVPMLPLFHTSILPQSHNNRGEIEPEPRVSVDAVVHVWLDKLSAC